MNEIHKIGAVVCAKDPTGEWRVLLRKNSPFNGSPEEWNVIYGHIEEGEGGTECAIREIREETGLAVAWANAANKSVSKQFPDGKKIVIDYYWTKFMKLPNEVYINEESIGYQWAMYDEVEAVVVDTEQRELIQYCVKKAAE